MPGGFKVLEVRPGNFFADCAKDCSGHEVRVFAKQKYRPQGERSESHEKPVEQTEFAKAPEILLFFLTFSETIFIVKCLINWEKLWKIIRLNFRMMV